MSENDLEELGY